MWWVEGGGADRADLEDDEDCGGGWERDCGDADGAVVDGSGEAGLETGSSRRRLRRKTSLEGCGQDASTVAVAVDDADLEVAPSRRRLRGRLRWRTTRKVCARCPLCVFLSTMLFLKLHRVAADCGGSLRWRTTRKVRARWRMLASRRLRPVSYTPVTPPTTFRGASRSVSDDAIRRRCH